MFIINKKLTLAITIITIIILTTCGCIENNNPNKENNNGEKPVYNSKTFTVGSTIDSNFSKIQDAIDYASANDTILVKPGIYQESIRINKTINLIGENLENTIIHSKNTTETIDGTNEIYETNRVNLITIIANNCVVKNFTFISNNKNKIIRGINLNTENNTIINCNLSGLYNAIKI